MDPQLPGTAAMSPKHLPKSEPPKSPGDRDQEIAEAEAMGDESSEEETTLGSPPEGSARDLYPDLPKSLNSLIKSYFKNIA